MDNTLIFTASSLKSLIPNKNVSIGMFSSSKFLGIYTQTSVNDYFPLTLIPAKTGPWEV